MENNDSKTQDVIDEAIARMRQLSRLIDQYKMDALRYAVMSIDTGGAGGYVGVVEWD